VIGSQSRRIDTEGAVLLELIFGVVALRLRTQPWTCSAAEDL